LIAELGHFALILALAASLAQGLLLIAGVRRGDAAWMAAGRHAAVVHPLLVAVAFAALVACFVGNDFTVKAVASHSHTALPAAYRAAAAWAGHEGAMLLWATMLAMWTLAVRFATHRLPLDLACRALGVLGLVSSGFLVVAIAVSSPFARLIPSPAQGRDLDPLLQDPAMLLHPPLVIAGYAGLAVAFALALAALLDGRLEAAWARWSRPWVLAAWCFLTAGIAAGALWASREPGWTGWWSWDPLQNASLMPWLAATALLHSLAVAEKRGLFRRWTVLLAILAFSLCLLGAYLARAGALSSLHAFAPDPRRGLAILALLASVAGAALVLFARSAAAPDGHGAFEMISREAGLAAATAVLVAALGAVMLGTLLPLVSEAAGLGRITVGTPYFTAVFLPLMLPGLLLAGPGPRLRWGSESPAEALRDSVRPAAAAAAAGAYAAFAAERPGAWTAIGLFVSAWIAWHVFEAVAFRWRLESRWSGVRTARWPEASFFAMHVAHFGVAVLVAGISVSNGFEQSSEFVLAPGATQALGSIHVRSDGPREVEGPNYRAVRVRIVVREGARETVVEPEKRLYRTSALPVTEVAVDAGLARDLHVSLVEPAGAGAWIVRVRVKPLMGFVWAGALLMILGGLLAVADRRYRAGVAARGGLADAALALAGSSPR
jgi:cytochrome c-type biogenesis protein CcmF